MYDNGRVYRDYCPTTAPLYPPLVVVQKLRFDMRQVIAACVGTLVPREHLDHLDLELSPNWPVRGQFKSRWIACCLEPQERAWIKQTGCSTIPARTTQHRAEYICGRACEICTYNGTSLSTPLCENVRGFCRPGIRAWSRLHGTTEQPRYEAAVPSDPFPQADAGKVRD